VASDFNLDPDFESVVCALACSDANFYAKVGPYIVPELCHDPAAKLAIEAAMVIHKETGRGPSNELAVFQRLQRWVDDGRVEPELINRLADIIDDGFNIDISPTDVVTELVPLLQGYHRHAAVVQLIKAHGRKEDLSREARLIEQANRIGMGKVSMGLSLGDQAVRAIADLKNLERFPVGVEDLDEGLGGGVPRQSLTLWVGASGDGKSMALSMVSAVAILFGLSVTYVTLEIPPAYVLARTQAALTGYTIDDFLSEEPDALDYMEEMHPDLGPFRVEYMEPGFTTVSDIAAFIDRVEDDDGRAVDMLVVDYLDRLAAPGARGKKRGDVSSYATGEIVTTQLRDDLIVPRNLWGHSAVQATRGTGRGKAKKGLDDMADSLHKGRIADNVFTLNTEEQAGGEVLMSIRNAKHRTGRSGFSVGPFPAEFERGRICESSLLEAEREARDWSTAF
jgi:hypothetical protein